MSEGGGGERRLLSVEKLTTGFDVKGRFVPAVINVSFHVAQGETLCLVGESGSGKSVTALSIMRLVQRPGRIAAGRIAFRGRDLGALSEREMQKVRGAEIALIFQEPMTALNPVFTIGNQIEETLLVHGRATRRAARQRAIELLDAVSMPEPQRRVRDYPHQLSGGLRQRALIAMALSCEPAIVIADEPTTALDVTIQAQILELLRNLQTRMGLALLLITHDLGVVAEMADRVAVMYAGRIVEEAPVAAMFTDPKHPYTRGLLGSIPGGAPGSRLVAIRGNVPPLGELPPGCCFEPRCPDRFEPCPKAQPGDTIFVIEGSDGVSESPIPNPDSRHSQHTVKCYLHGPAVELSPPGSDPGRTVTHLATRGPGSDPGRSVTQPRVPPSADPGVTGRL
jgi:oligopeptide/dipeptide ABC transporter ATP-binding protein